MNKMIAYCGLDCGKCDAFIATKSNDQALRERIARLWSELNNTPILPEQINCEGCRAEGVKTVFCSTLCEIRKCAVRKSSALNPAGGKSVGCSFTCGDCSEMEHCPSVGAVHANNPEARRNLTAGKESDR